jgi:hypothetical protein
MFLDVDIVANRLFGPEPDASTYVCIWEIQLSHIKGSITAKDAMILAAVGRAFSINFDDRLNAPAEEHTLPVNPDGEFLSIPISPAC